MSDKPLNPADTRRIGIRDASRTGRWGGDEFVVLLSNSTRQQARAFAKQLQERLGRHSIDIGPARITASASIGIAVHPDDGADPQALLAHADQQMYRVKRKRDFVAFVDEPA